MQIKASRSSARIRSHFFWLGVAGVVVGFIMHMPAYVMSADMGYRMSDMMMSMPWMWGGMALITISFAVSAYGLMPRSDELVQNPTPGTFRITTSSDTSLTLNHWLLISTLLLAMTIDVMKPATIGFVLPGMDREYGLTATEITWFPISAMLGTVLGSLMWGALADRIGRRVSILLAAVMFMGTSTCGAMPGYLWNVGMCFLMGAAAGGMLPIIFTLLAEMIPARQRGWITVLVAGVGTAGGYLAASVGAYLFEAAFSWRSLWFLGMPSGLLLLFLSRYIPESPRYLLLHGRVEAAHAITLRFGATISNTPSTDHPDEGSVDRSIRGSLRPYALRTSALALLGLCWGIVNFGLLTLLPTILRNQLEMDAVSSNGLLSQAALAAIPACAVAAILYGFWSTKKSVLLYATIMVFALFTMGLMDSSWLTVAIVSLVIGINGLFAILIPYATEQYPTHLRGLGTGIVAGASKAGGVVGFPLVAGLIAIFSGYAIAAIVIAIPLALAAAFLVATGTETRGLELDELHSGPVMAQVEMATDEAA